MAAWKLAPALATGNTSVLKPAETTPLTALLLAEVIQQAELPPGVVNVITGAGETGAALVAADVDKIAFTGSTEVGKHIRRAIAGTGKRLTLELGGKAANIVFEDAPLDQAVEGVVNGIFFNQGHVCCAGSRLLVQEPIFEALLDKLKARLADAPRRRPARQEHRRRRDQLAGAAREDRGARRVRGRGGRRDVPAGVRPPGARLLVPRRRCSPASAQSHRIAREEIFGPVLSILTFRTPEEAVEKANNTPYGLSAGVWTEKGSRILWMAERLSAGVVWANTFNRFDPASPFGGYKESGFGREGGLHGLEPYLELEPERRDERRAPARQADREAVHRRRVPAERVRPVLRGARHRRRVPGAGGARVAQGPPRRGARGARRAAGVGRRRPRTTAARSSTAWPS